MITSLWEDHIDYSTANSVSLSWGNCVACRASHFIELPCQTSFCPFLYFLLVCFRRLSTSLPPLCVILVYTMCIRVLLLYVSKITPAYFYFFIRARQCLFLSSNGSSLIGLPFPPSCCLSVVFVLVTCAVF